jgi:hypothetical protein
MKCKAIVTSKCAKDHKVTRKCHDTAGATCQKCEAEARALERRRQRDHKLDQERQANQKAYAARLAEIEDEIEHQKRLLGDRATEEERQKALAQKKQDLTNLQEKIKTPVNTSKHLEPVAPPDSAADCASDVSGDSPASHQSSSRSLDQTQSASDGTARQQDSDYPEWDKSEAKDDWKEQKALWGADNEALDSLMSMIGKFFR